MNFENDILNLSSKLIDPEDSSQATINRLRHFALQTTHPNLQRAALIGLTKIGGQTTVLTMAEILLTIDEGINKSDVVNRLAALSDYGGDFVLLASLFTDLSQFHNKLSALLNHYQEKDNDVLVRILFEIMRFAPKTDTINRYIDDILSILDMSGEKRIKAAGVLARALCTSLDQGDYIHPPDPNRLAEAFNLADEIVPGLVNVFNIHLELRLSKTFGPIFKKD